MSQSKSQIQQHLQDVNASPLHRFGQNFMTDANTVRLIAAAGNIQPNDWILEVGPGTGTLTEELLSSGAQVVAVEIDRALCIHLRKHFADNSRFTLIEGDALESKHRLNASLLASLAQAKADGKTPKLIANLPYQIASPLVMELLIAGVEMLVFTVQKEVADRLRATAGTDAYGPLTVMAQLLSRVEVLRTLSPGIFWPAPGVDSAIVKMTRENQVSGKERQAEELLRNLFSARRKTLRKALDQSGRNSHKLLEATGLDGTGRAENLSPAQILSLLLASLDAANA